MNPVLEDRYVTNRHESFIPCDYGDGRFVVASTFDPDLAAAIVRALIDMEADDA